MYNHWVLLINSLFCYLVWTHPTWLPIKLVSTGLGLGLSLGWNYCPQSGIIVHSLPVLSQIIELSPPHNLDCVQCPRTTNAKVAHIMK